MLGWLIVFSVGAIGSLAAARFISAPSWLDFLWLSGALFALTAAVALGLGARRLLGPRWVAPAALTLAVGATLCRVQLVARLLADPAKQVTIDLVDIAVATTTVAWGAVALSWGVLAISDSLESDPRARGQRWARAGAALAVVLALYCIAPLWRLLGLRIDHWTVLGLFGLAAVAYGAGISYRRIFGRRDQNTGMNSRT